jgi:hypothetical protein
MVVVITELFSSNNKLLEFIIVDVEISPFTIEVRVFTAEVSEFWFTNFAVVVEITPLTFDVNSKEFVEVEIVKLLLFIMVVVEIDPPIFEVKIFPIEENKFETDKLFTFKF